MDDRTPPELENVITRLENVVAPIRTRVARARDTLASQKPNRLGPDLLKRAAQMDQAAPELKAVAQAVSEGRTTWEQVAAGEADHLPEMKRFHSAALVRSRRIIQEWPRPVRRGREEQR